MIKDYVDGKLLHVCDRCGLEREIDPPTDLHWIEEFQTFAFIPLPSCPRCGAKGYINPNLPTALEDAEIADLIPDREWRQRTIIRAVTSAIKAQKPLPMKVPPLPKEVRKRGTPRNGSGQIPPSTDS